MKKCVASLLILSMFFAVFTGCGSNVASTAATTSAEVSHVHDVAEASVAPKAELSEEASIVEAPAEESPEAVNESRNVINYPLDGERVTLSMFNTFKAPFEEILNSSMFPNVIVLEELINVHIEWMDLDMMSASEQFNLLCAADDLPDMISNGMTYYNGSIASSIENDVFMELNDLLPTYAPDYWAMLSADESMIRNAMDDAGSMVSVYAIKDTYVAVGGSYVIRQDYLDALGLEVPETYEEFTEVLEAMVAEYHPECAFAVTSDNYTGLLTAGYDVAGNGFYQIDGVVNNTFVASNYRKYIELMVDWYDKGIIGKDFLSYASDPMNPENKARIYTGDNVVFSAQAEEFYTLADSATDENFALTAIHEPVETKGQITHFTDTSLLNTSNSMEISCNCENPETALMWLNYFYTEEGSDIGNYGILGESFDYDENGDPYFLDSFVNNEGGYALNRISAAYSGYGKWPMYNQETRLFQVLDDAQLEAYDVWHSCCDGAYLMSGVTLTVEESDQITSKYNDIETYVDENIAKFITGEKSMDEFDSFVDIIWSMGMQECIEVYQNSYDRYLQR